MTSDRDIERILDRWLSQRPTQVADRVLDEVADRIAREPRRPAWRVWGDNSVVGGSKASVAIAAAIIVAVVGFAVLGRPPDPSIGGPPANASPTTPTTSPAPTTKPSSASVASPSVSVGGACDLLTPAEAGAALHTSSAISAQSLLYDDTSAVTRLPTPLCWFHTGGSTSLFLLVDNRDNGAETFAIWKRSTGKVAVPLLGDDAVWDPVQTTLYILKRDRLVTIEPVDGPDPTLTLDVARAIGEIVARRM